MSDRYVIPDPGGYQRDAGATFGAGTLRPCKHEWVTRGKRGWVKERWDSKGTLWRAGDDDDTERCLGCGQKRTETALWRDVREEGKERSRT